MLNQPNCSPLIITIFVSCLDYFIPHLITTHAWLDIKPKILIQDRVTIKRIPNNLHTKTMELDRFEAAYPHGRPREGEYHLPESCFIRSLETSLLLPSFQKHKAITLPYYFGSLAPPSSPTLLFWILYGNDKWTSILEKKLGFPFLQVMRAVALVPYRKWSHGATVTWRWKLFISFSHTPPIQT